ncbi:MAG: hypothetical protein JNM56_31205, partial [Planctomycetia bacterium]|nr:hypothetical protein [Planctomycetia bacterium]
DLKRRLAEADAHAAQHQEAAALVEARAAQLSDLQQRLEADRQALKEREQALQRGEQARATLQEQLRRRSEELAARQRALTEQAQQYETAASALQEQQAALAVQRAELEQRQQQAGQQTGERLRQLDEREAVLARQQELLEARTLKLQEMGKLLAAERKVLAEEKTRSDADRLAVEQAVARSQSELDASKQELLDLHKQLPELEQQASTAVERLAAARERLREHLAELHAYAREARDGLEAARASVQAQAEDIHRRELALFSARDEHRLAVAHFRQQLLDWQDQVGEMKRSLAQNESRLERRQAEVEEQARAVDAGAAQLARQAEELSAQRQLVVERRTEMERHLGEMREWYRKKLRELSQTPGLPDAKSGAQPVEAAAVTPDENAEGVEPSAAPRDILTLTDEASAGDRELGELLKSLELVEADTLTALLVEARRQKRSLRQLLLSGGYLTLYQLALIEAGNLDALVLGPTRVIDRVRVTPHEAVYRVFDPRHGKELLLRHLAEAEAEDAVRPDEFRQRFAAAAAVRHPHLAGTLEVLDIAGRPAALQEWLCCLPSTDWPALVAVPGVWYRLVSQAALGLQTAHQAGLIHGRLDASFVVIAADGTVKLCGLGEPAWLAEQSDSGGEDAAADLAALGKIAAGWAALGPRSGKKAKPLPEPLLTILQRLTSNDPEKRYPSAAVLLEELERAGSDLPPNAEAWDRLLRHVREALNIETPARQSA